MIAGVYQTVPRAELWAPLQVLERTEGAVTICSDSKLFVDGWFKGEEACLLSDNADLREQFCDVANESGLANISVIKVLGYAKAEDLVSSLSTPLDLYGNAVADSLALRGAKQAAHPQHVVDRIKQVDQLAWKVQRRLLTIALECVKVDRPLERNVKPRQPANIQSGGPQRSKQTSQQKQLNRRTLLEEQGHVIEVVRGCKWRCRVCRQARAQCQTLEWLKLGRCPGVPGSMPATLQSEQQEPSLSRALRTLLGTWILRT